MRRYNFIFFFITVIFSTLLPYSSTEARYNNNFYAQQQSMRNQQMIRQQRQQQAAMRREQEAQRQRAAEMRRQQAAARRAQKLQQQKMRERQQQMQRQSRQRQEQAARKRQKMVKDRQNRLNKQKKAKNSKIQLAKQQKLIRQQQTLKRQRQLKDRQVRLQRLQKNRVRQQQTNKKKKNAQKALTMATLLANRTKLNSLKPLSKPRTSKLSIKQFQQRRLQQQKNQRLTKKLENQRKTTQARLLKIRKNQQRLQLKRKKVAKKSNGTKKRQLAKNKFPSCTNGVCKTVNCSFHGDTLVKTMDGFEPIKSLTAGIDHVWARNEITGAMDWKNVTALFSNSYLETVHINIHDGANNEQQTIVSNRIHRFYVGHAIKNLQNNKSLIGTNATGQWIESQKLKTGDKLLNSNGRWSIVSSIDIKKSPLEAYNITVDDYHTYFVKGAANDASAIWVHNECNKDSTSKTANQALRKAKQANGIPRTAQPDKIIKPNTKEGKKYGLDNRNVKLYIFTNNKGQKVHIRQDKPAKYREGGVGDQKPHFNAGLENTKLKQHHYYKK